MNKASLILIWLFTLSSFAHAEDSPSASHKETLEEAQAAITLTTHALEQASAWESQAKKNLDKANKALTKTPKSATAKKAVAAAIKELDTATAYKEKKNTVLQEELREKAALEEMALQNGAKAKTKTTKVMVYPTDKYNLFAEAFELVERIDAYFFYSDPLDYQNKTVMVDSKFDEMIEPGVARFTTWRNFGKSYLIVSNIPTEVVIPKDTTMLLAGPVTGFKKEVVSGELIFISLLKLQGAFICDDALCQYRKL